MLTPYSSAVTTRTMIKVTFTRRKKIKFPFARFLGADKNHLCTSLPFLRMRYFPFLAGELPTLSSSTDCVSRVSLATADIATQGYRYGHINAVEALRKQEDAFFLCGFKKRIKSDFCDDQLGLMGDFLQISIPDARP